MTAAWLVSIVVASVLGSVHCVAMCGPLVALHGGGQSLRLAFAHAGGRLATYSVLGAGAGVVGSAVDLAGRLGNIQRAATLLSGLAIVAWGIQIVRDTSRARTSAGAGTAFGNALVKLRARRPARRAIALGILTGLVPCGWLWAFAITAAGTGRALDGALVMTAFWLGTVPAMIGATAWLGWLRGRVPTVTACALVVLGLGALAVRWHDIGASQVTAPHCHCHGAET
jgi:sulfite exporter TauE/SafE